MPKLDKMYPDVTLEAHAKTWSEKKAERLDPNFRVNQAGMARSETRTISGTMTPSQRGKANKGTARIVGKGHAVTINGQRVKVPGTRGLGKDKAPLALSAYDRVRQAAAESAKANMSAKQIEKARQRIDRKYGRVPAAKGNGRKRASG